MAQNHRYYFIHQIPYIDYSKNIFAKPMGQINDSHDSHILHEAKRIKNIIEQKFSDKKAGFGESLYMTYMDVVNGESKLNKMTQSYVRKNFKDESEFRCYFMRHKDAPEVSIDKKA